MGSESKRVKLAAFTPEGFEVAQRIAKCPEFKAEIALIEKGGLKAWAKEAWQSLPYGLVFISAAGVAVRAIAPYIQDKLSDPAVLAVDEQGKFAISLLSGHAGGANRLAKSIAAYIGATPVITTASDLRGGFAIDEWASFHSLAIDGKAEMSLVIKAIMAGEEVGLFSDVAISGKAPGCFIANVEKRQNVYIGKGAKKEGYLALRPRDLAIGIGSRAQASDASVEGAARLALEKAGAEISDVAVVASIDIKAGEGAILRFAARNKLKFACYSKEELQTVNYPGLASSEFVMQTVGVDNVSERAALFASGPKSLLVCPKTAYNGATAALAKSFKEYSFEY